MAQFEERFYENQIICPYCGEENEDSWEFGDSEDEQECYECGKYFSWERHTSVSYTSKADCELNGEQHNYNEDPDFVSDKDGKSWYCTICGMMKFEPSEAFKKEMKRKYGV